MRCDEVKELITIFLEGELERETYEIVKAHIDSCESCKALMEDSLRIMRAIRSIKPLPVPDRVVDNILNATTRKRKRFSFFPLFQPQWVFAFSVFVLSFFFFTYPKKALLFDPIEFKAHRAYSQVLKNVTKINGVVDYLKGLKFKSISKPKEVEEFKREKKGAERISVPRDLKNLRCILF